MMKGSSFFENLVRVAPQELIAEIRESAGFALYF